MADKESWLGTWEVSFTQGQQLGKSLSSRSSQEHLTGTGVTDGRQRKLARGLRAVLPTTWN